MSTPDWPPDRVTTLEELEAALGPALESARVSYTELHGECEDPLALWHLQRGDVALVEPRMVALATDPRWEARALAADVLRNLTGPRDPWDEPALLGEPAVARAWLLCAMANVERDDRALQAIVSAFIGLQADLGEDAAAAFACRFIEHDAVGVRVAAAAILHGNRTPRAIAALLPFVADPSAPVRYWTCVSFGRWLACPNVLQTIDTPEIRDALARCLADESIWVREEALIGLAIRGDERGLAAIASALAQVDTDSAGGLAWAAYALEHAPRSRFVPHLEAIHAKSGSNGVAVALEACRATTVW